MTNLQFRTLWEFRIAFGWFAVELCLPMLIAPQTRAKLAALTTKLARLVGKKDALIRIQLLSQEQQRKSFQRNSRYRIEGIYLPHSNYNELRNEIPNNNLKFRNGTNFKRKDKSIMSGRWYLPRSYNINCQEKNRCRINKSTLAEVSVWNSEAGPLEFMRDALRVT